MPAIEEIQISHAVKKWFAIKSDFVNAITAYEKKAKLSYAGNVFTGEFCEVCETCQNQCTQLRPCVECLAFNSSKLLINQETMSPEEQREIRESCAQRCPLNYLEFEPTR